MKSLFGSTARRVGILFFLLSGCWLGQVATAQEEGKSASDYAILIVGDEGDAEMQRRERVLIKEMGRLRKSVTLSIYSYHFNKERERAYCEKKINVLKEDLLFVGLVSLKDRVPRKVLYRLDRITNPSRSAVDVMARADEVIAGFAQANNATATANVTTSSTPSVEASPGVKTEGTSKWRVQLGVFTQEKSAQDLVSRLKTKNYDARIEKFQADSTPSFRVWLGLFTTKEDAQQAVAELQGDGFDKGYPVEVK